MERENILNKGLSRKRRHLFLFFEAGMMIFNLGQENSLLKILKADTYQQKRKHCHQSIIMALYDLAIVFFITHYYFQFPR